MRYLGRAVLAIALCLLISWLTAYFVTPRPAADQHYKRALALYEANRHAAALEVASLAIEANPEDARAYRLRGTVRNFLGKAPEALADLDEAIRLDPESADGYLFRAESKFGQKDFPAVLADCDEAFKRGRQDWRVHLFRGFALMMLGNHQRAISDLDAVLKETPNHRDTLVMRGTARVALGQYQLGLDDLNKALELGGPSVLHVQIGIAHMRLGEYDEALQAFNVALGEAPNTVLALASRGVTLQLLGRYEEAHHDLTRAIELAPLNHEAAAGLASFLTTCPDERFRNPAEAVQYGTTACEQSNWTTAEDLDVLAAACSQAGDFDKAVEYQQRAIALVKQAGDEVATAERQILLEDYEARRPYEPPVE